MAFGWYFHDFPTLQGSHFSLELLKSGNKTLYPDTDCPHVLTLGCIWGRLLHLRHHSLRRFPVPLVSTGIFRKAPAHAGAGGAFFLGVPFGEDGGESPRGEGDYQLRGRPSICTPPLGVNFGDI